MKSFPVTDPELDAPDGAVVDGFERVGNRWVLRFPYVWRVHTRPLTGKPTKGQRGTRKGQRCRVLVRGGRNSAEVEFEDGTRIITSRNYLRKAVLP